MPMYDYQCPNGHEFEDMQSIANRHTAPCRECGEEAKMVMRTGPRIDPNADLPGLRMQWRRKAEERGRGKDMTSANRTVSDEQTVRDAHAQRALRGENPIIV